MKKHLTLKSYLDDPETMEAQALAAYVGISDGYLSAIKHGHQTPGLRVALKISEITGVPLKSLSKKKDVAA